MTVSRATCAPARSVDAGPNQMAGSRAHHGSRQYLRRGALSRSSRANRGVRCPPGPWHASVASPSRWHQPRSSWRARSGLRSRPLVQAPGLRERSWHRSGVSHRRRSVPGVPETKHPAFAQPFHTLDADALRAAKLHAAAIASRGSRGPSIAPHAPLAGLFNNLNSPGLNQLTATPPDSTGAIGPNNYVEMVNQEIGVYDRNLNLISSTDNGTFTGAGAACRSPIRRSSGTRRAATGCTWHSGSRRVPTCSLRLVQDVRPERSDQRLVSVRIPAGATCSTTIPSSDTTTTSSASGRTTTTTPTANYTFLTANIFAIRKPQAGDTSCAVDTALYVADATHPLHNADGSTAFTPVPANTVDSSSFGYIVAAHSPVDGVGSSAPKIMVWHWA